MGKNLIITVGRQYGSGGREIGEKLAKLRNVPCYDKELLEEAAKKSGYCEEMFQNYDEKPVSSLLYSMAMGTINTFTNTQIPISVEAFLAQYHTIESIAEEQKSCVFIGRCADYALKEKENVLNVFIHADEESRIERISARNQVTEEKSRTMMHRNDKNRASYYGYYTEQRWGDAKNYHLCLDSAKIGIDGCVDMIQDYAEYFLKNC